MLVARRCLVLLMVVSMVLMADSAFAQRGGRGGGRGGFGGFGGGGALGLLQNKSVQKELELLDDQIAQVAKLNEDSRGAMRELFTRGQNLTAEERTARFQEYRENQQKDIDKILLPHQSERLKQIEFQMSLRRGGRGGGGGGVLNISDDLAEALGLTAAQREQLETASEAAGEELRQQQNELANRAREKIIAKMSPQQRAKYKQLVGEPFDYVPDPFGGRGGPGGGQGGRGGRGGNNN